MIETLVAIAIFAAFFGGLVIGARVGFDGGYHASSEWWRDKMRDRT
jgi:hypothetical protein